MSACPYCDFATNEPDDGDPRVRAAQEIEHMQAIHPEIIAERLKAAGIHPDEFRSTLRRNLSEALDEVPVLRILSTVKALRGANVMADRVLAAKPDMKAYVAGHDEVCDALEAYCACRVVAEGMSSGE